MDTDLRALARALARCEQWQGKVQWLERRRRDDFARGGKPFRSALRRHSWRRPL
jgi:hypothetical protein